MPIHLWEFESPLFLQPGESPNDRLFRVQPEEVVCRREIRPRESSEWETYREDVTPKSMQSGQYTYELLVFNDTHQTGIITMRPNTEYALGWTASQYGKEMEFVTGRRSFALGPYDEEKVFRRRFPIIRQTNKGKTIEAIIFWATPIHKK